MAIIVGVSDMRLCNDPGEKIVTYSLGTCIGVTVYDPVARVGGMLHFQLPSSIQYPNTDNTNPFSYADTGVRRLVEKACRMGASKKRIIANIAGGASVIDNGNHFRIGEKNIIAAKRALAENGISLSGEDVGGNSWRTITLVMATGELNINSGGKKYTLKEQNRLADALRNLPYK